MPATYKHEHLRALENYEEEKLNEVRAELDEGGKDTTPDKEYVADVDEALEVVAPSVPPTVANANGTYIGQQNNPVQFSSAGSSGQNLSYLWDFGDNSTSTQANPSHAYIKSKTFNVTLTVTGDGGQDVDTTTCTVTPFGGP